MSDVSQPRMARGKMALTAGLAVAAMLATFLFVPIASAASDPVGSGNARLTLTRGFSRTLLNKDLRLQRIKPANLKSRTLSFKLNGGSIDPATGKGNVKLQGGFKFRHHKRAVAVKGLTLDTTKGALNGVVGGKRMKVAAVVGFHQARNGFGVNLTIKKLKLTGAAAKRLNAKLGLRERRDRAFKGGQVMGAAKSTVQPSTVGVIATGSSSLTLSKESLEKLASVAVPVTLAPVAPTTVTDPGPPPTVAFPLAPEGTVSPDLTAGTIKHFGGLLLTQDLEFAAKGVTKLTLGNIWVDLATKAATVEVTIENEKTPELNLGNLGRVSIADLNLAGATVNVDPNTRTISVQNAAATLQALTAATLNQVFVESVEGKGKTKFAAGDSLGTFSFSAQTE
jgi:Htaa